MDNVYRVLKILVYMGPAAIIPIVLLIPGLIASRNRLALLKNIVFIYIGLLSFSVLLNFYIGFFNPIINTILSVTGKNFQVIDAGWLVASKINIYSPLALQIFLILIGLNLIMLFLRITRTINIDIFNIWIFMFSGLFIYELTGIVWMSILFSCVSATITYVLSDIYAPSMSNYYGLKGISVPQAQNVVWAPISEFINFVFNRIPFMRKVHVFYDELQYKLGIFGEPAIIGFTAGFAIGAVTKFREFKTDAKAALIFCLISGVYLLIIAILMPRSVSLIYRGLVPVINDIRSFINSKITKRTLYIGVNSFIVAGNSSVIGLSAVMIPLTVYIAAILPGNRVLPGADLVLIPLILIWAVGLSRGDILRSFISAIIIIPLVLLLTTDMTSFITDYMVQKGIMENISNYNRASSMEMGSNLIFWILNRIVEPIMKLFS